MMAKKILVSLLGVVLLGACQQLPSEDQATATADNQANAVSVYTNDTQLSSAYYRAMIIEGEYQPSQSLGVSYTDAIGYNLPSYEQGLYKLAQGVFPTDQYYFAEGQVLSSDLIQEWLAPKSEKNPEGLNPANSLSNREDNKKTLYLNQIIEQNLITQSQEGYEISAISIGIAMNSVDYYDIEGTPQEKVIPDAEIEVQGKSIGNEIVKRIRKNSAYKDTPILIGIFKNAPRDNIAGGTYIFEGLSTSGDTVAEWVKHNTSKVIYTIDNAPNQDDLNSFQNFRSEITDFFPSLSGVSGIGSYEDRTLTNIDITVSSKYSGYTEIVALTQQVVDSASRYLPANVEVEIRIKNLNDTRATLTRRANDSFFSYQLLD